MKQAALKIPVRIEIVQMCDARHHYDIWCYFADGDFEPYVSLPDYGTFESRQFDYSSWYVIGLKNAVLAARERWGCSVPIELARCPWPRYRPRLRLA